MTPLLEAAVAAREAGLEVPACEQCEYTGLFYSHSNCHATGIHPDPVRLGWVALMWLTARANDPALHAYSRSFRFVNYTEGANMLEFDQAHDGTETGITTALLRLVARVGKVTP